MKVENLNFHVIRSKVGIGIYSSSEKTENFVYISKSSLTSFSFGQMRYFGNIMDLILTLFWISCSNESDYANNKKCEKKWKNF